MRVIYAIFLSPLLICFLFVHELTGSLVQGATGMDDITWQAVRIGFIILFLAMRLLIFREELQFQFDQSYTLIKRLMQDKDERLFKYIQARIT